MIVDSSALVAIILGEAEGAAYTHKILRASGVQMSAASYLEVALRIDTVQIGLDPAIDATIYQLGIEIVSLTPEQGRLARVAHSRFGRARHPASLNFGDCLTYALAKATGKPLLFKGNDFTQTDLDFVRIDGDKD